MVQHICPTCGKIFTHKSTYDRHLNKKKKCLPQEVDEEEKESENGIEDKYDLLIKKIEELEKKNKNLEETMEVKNKEFEKEIKKLKKNSSKTVSNVNSNNTMNVIVMPKAFGTENADFLENSNILSRKILTKGYQSVPEFVKSLHFDESKPENHNVYIPNWRDKTRVLVYDGKNWNLMQTESVIDDLKNKGIEFIQRKYNELDKNNPADVKIMTKLGRFLESYNSGDKEKIDILNEDICLVLYNNRQIPSDTRKK